MGICMAYKAWAELWSLQGKASWELIVKRTLSSMKFDGMS
jgi:hypothetical protein